MEGHKGGPMKNQVASNNGKIILNGMEEIKNHICIYFGRDHVFIAPSRRSLGMAAGIPWTMLSCYEMDINETRTFYLKELYAECISMGGMIRCEKLDDRPVYQWKRTGQALFLTKAADLTTGAVTALISDQPAEPGEGHKIIFEKRYPVDDIHKASEELIKHLLSENPDFVCLRNLITDEYVWIQQ